ncbi:glycoside hydrolase family 115 protein [Paxillus involutus ATCC 200175]|nr:glycoside hydrolase family 115 protein [Paxillus involutus ATCC 200175]
MTLGPYIPLLEIKASSLHLRLRMWLGGSLYQQGYISPLSSEQRVYVSVRAGPTLPVSFIVNRIVPASNFTEGDDVISIEAAYTGINLKCLTPPFLITGTNFTAGKGPSVRYTPSRMRRKEQFRGDQRSAGDVKTDDDRPSA